MATKGGPVALIAALEEDAVQASQVMYGLIRRENKDEIVSTAAKVNVVPRKMSYQMADRQEVEMFAVELLKRPIVLLSSVVVKRGLGRVKMSTKEERWVVMVNQVHPKIMASFLNTFEAVQTRLEDGDPFELTVQPYLSKEDIEQLAESTRSLLAVFRHAGGQN